MISTDRWIILNETASTNTLLLDGDYPAGAIVTALRQTAGRGRRGRRWDDSPDRSFLFSLLLEFEVMPPDAGFLSLLVGLCVLEAAEAALATLSPSLAAESGFALKWPNDVLLSRHGLTGKLAGILLESRVERDRFRLVTGIGLNWSDVPGEPGGRFPPVALLPRDHPDGREPGQFLTWLLRSLNGYQYDRGLVGAAARDAVWKRSFLAGRTLRTREGEGIVTGLDRDGALLLDGPAGIFRFDRTDEEYEIL